MGIDPVNVANINATVLTILVAVGTLYLGRLFGPTDERRTAVLVSASRVNNVPAPAGWVFLGALPRPLEGSSPRDQMKDLLRMARESPQVISLRAGPNAPHLHQGQAMAGALSILLRRYPFREFVTLLPGGGNAVQGETSAAPVPLDTVDQAAAWVDDIRYVADDLRWLRMARNLDEHVAAWGQAAGVDTRGFVDGIVRHAEFVEQIAEETRQRITELRAVEKMWPTRKVVATAAVAMAITFAVGVVLPMLVVDPPHVLFAWVPALFYAGLVTLMLRYAWRWVGPPRPTGNTAAPRAASMPRRLARRLSSLRRQPQQRVGG